MLRAVNAIGGKVSAVLTYPLVLLSTVCEGQQRHRPSADLSDADRGVGPGSSTLGGGAGGRG